jgi:putative hemolysin
MFELFIILICLIINAILAGSETAFIAVSKPTLQSLVKQGNEKAKLMLRLRENPERTLSIIQIGITFVGAFAAAIGGAGAEESISPWLSQNLRISDTFAEILAILLVVVPLTYASVVLGELVPKSLALRRPTFIAFLAAPWLIFTNRLLNPIVTIFESSTKMIINLFPKRHTTSDEKETLAATLEDVVTPLNKQYIMNMVKIERTTVKEIFVDWKHVVFADVTNTIEEVEQTLITSGHTRLPVIEDGNVIGILNSKEFLAFQKTGKSDWISLCRQTISLQESTLILTGLRLLQEKKAHLAIVYNGAQKTGIVTMEAIFEEIIGDIYDEDDEGSIQKILSMKRF